ncbi:MAG: hypothetical protein AABY44_04825 [Nitrospirota bacterium]
MTKKLKVIIVIFVLYIVVIGLLPVQIGEAFFYFLFSGIVFSPLWVIIIILMLAFKVNTGYYKHFFLLKRILFFTILLYLWGAVGDTLWFTLITDKLYIRADPTTNYIPIVPFGWWAIDEMCGGRLVDGISIWHLRGLWLIWSIVIWFIAIITYRLILMSKPLYLKMMPPYKQE